MSGDPPRHLPPTPEERLRTVVSRMAGGSAAGQTRFARPVTRNAGAQQGPASGVGGLARLGVLYRLDTTGLAASNKLYVPAWTDTEEDLSGSALSADPDGGIGIYLEGIYSVHMFVHGEGMQSAAANCVLIGFCDYFDPFTESFACVSRGGDPSSGRLFPSTSRTYYHPGTGSGALQPGLDWVNLVPATVTELLLEVQVQQIA